MDFEGWDIGVGFPGLEPKVKVPWLSSKEWVGA